MDFDALKFHKRFIWNLLIPSFVLGVITILPAQNILSISPGAGGAAIGSVRTTQADAIALLGNQAGAAFASDAGWYVSAERRFGLEELNYLSGAFLYPTSLGSFGITILYHGFDAYNEQLIGLSYSRALAEELSISTQLDYLNLRIPSYGHRSAFTFELGLYSKIVDQLVLGFHTFNPLKVEWTEGQLLSSRFSLGLAYQPFDELILYSEIEKSSLYPANIKMGLSYLATSHLFLRAGVQTELSIFSIGIGYQFSNGLTIDFSTLSRQGLGLSPVFGIGQN